MIDIFKISVGSNDCCTSFKFTSKNHSSCQAIPIPENDPVYSEIAGECLPFQRTTTNFEQNCSNIDKSAEQVCENMHKFIIIIYSMSEIPLLDISVF